MNFKKFISGVSALTIAASAFAGMAVTANAAEKSATLAHTASQVAGATKRQWNYTLDQTEIAAGGNNGAGKSYAGYAYLQFTLPELGEGELIDTASLSLPIKFASNSGNRGAVLYQATGLTIAEGAEAGVYNYGGYETAPINSWDGGGVTVSQITSTTFVRGTNTAPLSYTAWANDVTDAVSAIYSADGTTVTFAVAGDAAVSSAYPTINSADATLTITTKAAGAADDISISYQAGGTEVATKTIDLPSGLTEGGSYSYYAPAYVTGTDGKLYTVTKNYNRTATLAAGTTNVVENVTLFGDGYFFEAEDNGGNVDEATNAGAYSNGKGKRRLDQKQVKITVPADGVYTVKAGFVSSRSNSTTDTVSAYKDTYSAEATPLFSFSITQSEAYYGNDRSQDDVKLKANDKLVFYTSSWNTGLDYVLLKKTADYPYAITKAATENGSFTVSAETATAGTNVTITPTAASGYEVDTVTVKDSANNDVTVTNNSFTMPAGDVTVSVTFKAVTPAAPTAEVTGISYQQFAAEDTDAKSDVDVTAAKVFVEITGTAKTLGLEYAGNTKNVANFKGLTDANIVLGAIIPGLVELETTSFTAVVD